MRKRTKIWLITGAVLIALGVMIVALAMVLIGGELRALDTTEYQSNSYEIDERFMDVFIVAGEADIRIELATDGKCRVECYETSAMPHTVAVENDCLRIVAVDQREWYHHIGIVSFDSPHLTVYLPEAAYRQLTVQNSTGDVTIAQKMRWEQIKITASTGDISISDATVGGMTLSVSTGDIGVQNVTCEGDMSVRVSTGEVTLQGVTCANLGAYGSTDDITLQNVIATDAIRITWGTGNVTFDGCDAAALDVDVSTGDVKGTISSPKIFEVKTSTGDVRVPQNGTDCGTCKITTDTGDIDISLE